MEDISSKIASILMGQASPIMSDASPDPINEGDQYAMNVHHPFLVVDPRNATIVGSATTEKGANSVAERKNTAYGAQLYIPIPSGAYGNYIGKR